MSVVRMRSRAGLLHTPATKEDGPRPDLPELQSQVFHYRTRFRMIDRKLLRNLSHVRKFLVR